MEKGGLPQIMIRFIRIVRHVCVRKIIYLAYICYEALLYRFTQNNSDLIND